MTDFLSFVYLRMSLFFRTSGEIVLQDAESWGRIPSPGTLLFLAWLAEGAGTPVPVPGGLGGPLFFLLPRRALSSPFLKVNVVCLQELCWNLSH